MATPVEIGIFCVGRTVVDRDEVRRWLDFIGASEFELPEDGAISNPALLVALAGKRCYKSFTVDPALNPNITKIREDYAAYFDNILASGHGSVLEHSVYNFAFENVSRVFTAEMNRHRAGWAISEGSLRFIRFGDNIPYWVPDSIKGPAALDDLQSRTFHEKPLDDLAAEIPTSSSAAYDLITADQKKDATRIVFRRAFESQEKAYRVLEKIWADELSPTSKFKAKKEITSLLRRIVGLGVASGGVWSGNLRGLRHVLTMRCAPSAEEEILHVFSRVAVMMQSREPMLFGDFYMDENGFWRPKYVKV